jgi:hypothetical protein
MTALWGLGQRGVDGIAELGTSWGWWCHGFKEDDSVAGLGESWGRWHRERRVDICQWRRGLREDDNVTGLGMARVDCIVGLGTLLVGLTASLARGRGRLWRVRRAWSRSGMMTRWLQGGLDVSASFGEVNNGAGYGEIFDRKCWHPDGVSKNLRGLGFAKDAEWFIYKGTTSSTGTCDVTKPVATEDHIYIV